ncbi:MAG: hypothetical protein MI863_08920 [Desulfobacterales bacterium]|nr:hypothetical protein [Desulfobacterales bacterium]
MKKLLIGTHNLEDFIRGDKLCLGPEHILSPGARDAARNRGISIVYGNSVKADQAGDQTIKASAGEKEESREELGRRIVMLLKTRFNLSDPAAIRDITLEVLKRIEKQ